MQRVVAQNGLVAAAGLGVELEGLNKHLAAKISFRDGERWAFSVCKMI